ncbi:MAG: hypothetical protein ABSA15_00450 [Thermoplasmata archaeon]
MKSLHRAVPQVALVGLVLVVLLAAIVPVSAAPAATTTTYTLYGYVEQPTGAPNPVPAGVTVSLVSQATNQTYTATTIGGSGQFTFSSVTNAPGLTPGWWGAWVAPQASLTLSGCSPCAAIPQTPSPVFSYFSASNLGSGGTATPVTITGVSILPYSSTLQGTVTYAGRTVVSTVQLLDPAYNGFVLGWNTTTSNGSYKLQAPEGTWVAETTVPGPTIHYNLTQVVINAPIQTVNISAQDYLISGFENVAGTSPAVHVGNGGNVTVYDPSNGYIYSGATPPGGFYSFGTYPADFVSGPQPFDVFLSPVGYSTAYYAQTVSANAPIYQNVAVNAISPPAVYTTVLNFSGVALGTQGSGTLAVSTTATLGANAVIPTFANASVGDLWSQLGLDWNHSVYFPASSLPTVATAIQSAGPFFPAVQAATSINGTAFNEASTNAFTYSSTCVAGSCGPTSTSTLTLNYAQSYGLSSTVRANNSQYTFAFNYRYPTQAQSFVYRVVLPQGYSLAAGTAAPANTQLSATGKGNTWTSFSLTSLSSGSGFGTATFSVVKFGGVTASVNASVSSFTFSQSNVLNESKGNYTVVVGLGQNVTFSALNSTYPSGTNGSFFVWNFGDGTPLNASTHPTTYHTYAVATTQTALTGTLTVTNSGGLVNTVAYHVWVVSAGLTKANISYNATGTQVRQTTAGTTYLYVNWSTTLQFNASGSSANVGFPAVPSVLSVASFKVTANQFQTIANFSVSQGARFLSNWSLAFLGNGLYLSNGIVGSIGVPFLGWQYNMTLTVWDGEGHAAAATLVILVVDQQKPLPAFQIQNAKGKPVPGSGVIEGANGTAQVQFNGANSTDPNNGSVVQYTWHVNNTANRTVNLWYNQSASVPPFTYPGAWTAWLYPQATPYTINLTTTDRAGNVAWTSQALTVSVNTTTRPIMAANNLNAPGSMTAGSSYTIWVNVTVGGGSKSVANNVQVAFYLLPPSGVGSPNFIVNAGSSSVQFYNYTNGIVNPTPWATGTIPSLPYGATVRAQISWTPGPVGNWILYANATASNEFPADYVNGPNLTSTPITVNQNPINLYIEYAIIAAVAVIIIVLLVFLFRRRARRANPKTGRSGLERGSKRDKGKDNA